VPAECFRLAQALRGLCCPQSESHSSQYCKIDKGTISKKKALAILKQSAALHDVICKYTRGYKKLLPAVKRNIKLRKYDPYFTSTKR